MARTANTAIPKILVVEDNFLMAEVICDFVRACGLEPIGPVATVEAGVHVARQEDVDAAVLDINLQGRMCFPICSVLLQKHVPFVFLSGYANSPLIPNEFRAAPHIEKPFAPEEFESILHDLVARRANGYEASSALHGIAP